jgi:hypothetical protein
MYPEAMLPQERDEDGNILDEDWRKREEDRQEWVSLLRSQEGESDDDPLLSSCMFGPRTDLVWCILRWENKTPWMYEYLPVVENGLNIIQEMLT